MKKQDCLASVRFHHLCRSANDEKAFKKMNIIPRLVIVALLTTFSLNAVASELYLLPPVTTPAVINQVDYEIASNEPTFPTPERLPLSEFV